MTILYGIPNCDSVKKTRKWLEGAGQEYHFHDFRADGLTQEKARQWIDHHGWEQVVNRRSTSWKQLSGDARENMDAASALAAIVENPTLIKRPVLEKENASHIGFSPESYAVIFS